MGTDPKLICAAIRAKAEKDLNIKPQEFEFLIIHKLNEILESNNNLKNDKKEQALNFFLKGWVPINKEKASAAFIKESQNLIEKAYKKDFDKFVFASKIIFKYFSSIFEHKHAKTVAEYFLRVVKKEHDSIKIKDQVQSAIENAKLVISSANFHLEQIEPPKDVVISEEEKEKTYLFIEEIERLSGGKPLEEIQDEMLGNVTIIANFIKESWRPHTNFDDLFD